MYSRCYQYVDDITPLVKLLEELRRKSTEEVCDVLNHSARSLRWRVSSESKLTLILPIVVPMGSNVYVL